MSRKGENIYKRMDGRWEGRYIRDKINGKAKYGYVYATTYKEVKEKLTIAKSQVGKALTFTPTKTKVDICSFSQIANEWLNVNTPKWKLSSVEKYSNILNNHLMPEFGLRNITEISRDDVMRYISKLLLNGGLKGQELAPKTVNSIVSVMKNIFEYAVANKGYVLISFKGLNVKQVQKPMRILSSTEQNTLTKYLIKMSNETGCGILLSLYTGLRIGELCALKWENISFDEKCLYVYKTMQRLQTKDNSNHKTEVIISTPKSECSIRVVPIPDKLLKILQEHQSSPNAYVLTGVANLYVEPRTMQNRFKSIIKRNSIASANFHALRHTFATRCVELGFDIKSLSEILGHTSVNITLNKYVHPSMELKKKNMNMLSDLLTVK